MMKDCNLLKAAAVCLLLLNSVTVAAQTDSVRTSNPYGFKARQLILPAAIVGKLTNAGSI